MNIIGLAFKGIFVGSFIGCLITIGFLSNGVQFTGTEQINLLLGCMAIGTFFSIPSIVYKKENLSLAYKVIIQMGIGFCALFAIAIYLKWLPIDQGLYVIVQWIIISLAIGFSFWLGFYGYYSHQAKMMTKRIRELNKLYVRFGSEDERKLINLLINIFELKIDFDKKSIDSVRWGIKNWIKENRLPLWLFNYSEKITPSLKKAINGLSELLRPENKSIPDSTIQNCYDSIDYCRFDFEDLINSNMEEIFKNYVFKKEDRINSDDIPEVIDYIISVMPEEIYDWNEETVDNKILKWYIKSIETQTSNDSIIYFEKITEPSSSETGNRGQEESNSLISKIEKEKPENVKAITIMILKENEDFRLAYEKYFKDDMNGL